MLALLISLAPNYLGEQEPQAVAYVSVSIDDQPSGYPIDLKTLNQWKQTLVSRDLARYTPELPGLRPLRAFPVYLSFVERSLSRYTGTETMLATSAKPLNQRTAPADWGQ